MDNGIERNATEYTGTRPKFCIVVHLDNTYRPYHPKPNQTIQNQTKQNTTKDIMILMIIVVMDTCQQMFQALINNMQVDLNRSYEQISVLEVKIAKVRPLCFLQL